MISIISPSKSMNFESDLSESTNLKIGSKTQQIINHLQKLSIEDIEHIMSVSKKIATLNYERFQSYDNLPVKQALFAYDGDVYQNLMATTLTQKMLDFTNDHLTIISALYGALSPLEVIKPYRLEMSTTLPKLSTQTMSAFWKTEVTNSLNKRLDKHKNKLLINIASSEYSNTIDRKLLNCPMINIHFREIRNGEVKNIAIKAKRARGMIANYIVKNYIDDKEALKSFNYLGYKYDKKISNDTNFFFISHYS